MANKDELYERILTLRRGGLQLEEIATALQCSYSTVKILSQAATAAERGNIERIDTIEVAHSKTIADYIRRKYGIEKSEKVKETMDRVPIIKEQTDNTGTYMVKLLEAQDRLIKTLEGVNSALSRISAALNNTAQAAHEDAERTRQFINANSDILRAEVAASKELLVGIKSNTKR